MGFFYEKLYGKYVAFCSFRIGFEGPAFGKILMNAGTELTIQRLDNLSDTITYSRYDEEHSVTIFANDEEAFLGMLER